MNQGRPSTRYQIEGRKFSCVLDIPMSAVHITSVPDAHHVDKEHVV